MKNYIIYIPISAYFIYILYKLYQVWKNKEADSSIKFSKGTNNYTGKVIFFTVIATMVGPGFSYGAIDKFSTNGFFFTIFFLLTMLQFWLFGHFFVGKIKNISGNNETTGDILGKAYGKWAQIITGIITVAFSIAIVGVISLGGGKAISGIMGIPVSTATSFVILFITLYSFFGGISAVIKTDKLQFWLIMFLGIYGIIASFAHINTTDIEFTTLFSENWYKNDLSTKEIIGIGFAFFLGEAFLPVYFVRGLISKDSETAKKAFKKVAYFGFVWFLILTFIGIVATSTKVSDELSYLSLVKSVFNNNFGLFFLGIALTGMISVVMSTLDSILNTGGVSFRKDIMEQLFTVKENDKLTYTRMAILFIATSGLILTIFENDIVSLLIIGYTIWVPTITFPLAYYLLKDKIKYKKSGLIGMIVGIIGYIAFEYFIKSFIPSIVAGLFFNVLALLITEKLKDEK